NKATDFGGFRGKAIPIIDDDAPELTKKDFLTLKKNSNVSAVMESVSESLEIEFMSQTSNINVKAINPQNWNDFLEYDFDSGRELSVSDNYSVVLGHKIANDRFDDVITIGRKIMIEGEQFNVVGILEEGENDNAVLIPLDVVWSITDNTKDTYSQLQAKLINAELTQETVDELDAALMISRKVNEKDKDFTLSSPLEMQEQIQSVTGTMTLFLAAIAAVSLIVGAVGIANSMFTSVLEKIKEIGIMKALGATDGEVLKLFMIESALFGLVGGIIGVIFGIFGSVFLGFLMGGMNMPGRLAMTTLVTPQLIIIAIILSTGIGFFSGVLPARSASKLKPIDALRYE
ncbi:MAG: ABC transporter permease, partial [Candidatus Diapherotrites archaeon]|nr:ABC transporter permease [Candidatus Diapherotrites archaeon]